MVSRPESKLTSYDFEVVHCPGKLNVNTDALSPREDEKMLETDPAEIAEQLEYIKALAGYNIGLNQLYYGQTDNWHLRTVRWWVVMQQKPDKMTMRGKHGTLQTYYLWFESLGATDNVLLD